MTSFGCLAFTFDAGYCFAFCGIKINKNAPSSVESRLFVDTIRRRRPIERERWSFGEGEGGGGGVEVLRI